MKEQFVNKRETVLDSMCGGEDDVKRGKEKFMWARVDIWKGERGGKNE